jgi:nitroreductase
MGVIEECIALAQQAPTGSNLQRWHFVVVTDPELRAAVGDYYGQAFARYRDMPTYAGKQDFGDEVRNAQQFRVTRSAEFLADNMGRAPALVIGCVEGRTDGLPSAAQAGAWGGIIPAMWSFMLAARARGLGTCWTTLHLLYEREVAELLGIPYDDVAQAVLTPLAHTVGVDFKAAERPPVETVTHIDGW